MEKYIIIPDITCDLSQEIRDYFGLEDYVQGYVHVNNESLRTTLDWSNISREKFYKTLSNKKCTVHSAAASPEEYYQIFKKYIEQGYAVLSMSISSKISATFNVAQGVVNRIKEEYPNSKIYALDTLRMSGSFGLLVAYACQLKKEGKTFEEVVEWLEQNKERVHQMGPIDDLTVVAKRAQISKVKAFMGNLIGIKPMGDSNQDGYVTVLTKVKGLNNALDVTVKYIQNIATKLEDQYIFVMHSDREKAAFQLKEQIENAINCKKVFVSDVFSGCGTNIGAGMICAYFMGEPISENLEKEKEAIEKAVQ